MKLKHFSLAAFISLCYMFLNRAISTVSLTFNYIPGLIGIKLLFIVLSYLAIILFFIIFIKEFVHKDDLHLLNASTAVLIGTIALLIVSFVNGLALILPAKNFSNQTEIYLVNVIIWIYLFLIFIFYLYLYSTTRKMEMRSLINPIRWAMAGTTAGFLVCSVNFLNYSYYSQRNIWFMDIQNEIFTILGSILILFFFITQSIFLLKLRSYQINQK